MRKLFKNHDYQRKKMMQQEQSPSGVVPTIPTEYYINLHITRGGNYHTVLWMPRTIYKHYRTEQWKSRKNRKMRPFLSKCQQEKHPNPLIWKIAVLWSPQTTLFEASFFVFPTFFCSESKNNGMNLYIALVYKLNTTRLYYMISTKEKRKGILKMD